MVRSHQKYCKESLWKAMITRDHFIQELKEKSKRKSMKSRVNKSNVVKAKTNYPRKKIGITIKPILLNFTVSFTHIPSLPRNIFSVNILLHFYNS